VDWCALIFGRGITANGGRVIGYKLKVIGAENEEATSLRQGPLSPKVRLKKKLNREWGKSYWLFVIGYWGKRKERLFDFLTNNH
jgi:hypothetical protein